MSSIVTRLGLLALLIVSALIGLGAACNGTHRQATVNPNRPDGAANASNTPSVRIYYLVDLDGYLEPCGCQSRPLGGIDRLARFIERERPRAPNSMLVATGNLLYRDPTMDPRMDFQESTKADSMVRILDQLNLTAFAPGPSDFVRGADAWAHSIALGHATAVAANVDGSAQFRRSVIREIQGIRVGIVGVSDFRETSDATPPAGSPNVTDPVQAARLAVEEIRRQGAQVVVVLASVPRRIARTIAGDVPGVNFVIAAREESLHPAPPEQIGTAFLVSAANQGKSVGVLDLYLRSDSSSWTDSSDATLEAQRTRLEARITELRTRIDAWNHDPSVDRAAVSQQTDRLHQLEAQRVALLRPAAPPGQGSYFHAEIQEIAPELPKRPDVEQTIASYFRTVNDHNHVAYADLHAPPPVPGQRAYVGMEACRDCHAEAFDIWERTPHSHAYRTLEVISKNFNLSCVGCHVTGYRRPGGAEVVQNEGRQDVTCESCHGPGSQHIAAHTPAQLRATIVRTPQGSFCAGECHTPEHSDHFDYTTYLPRILGPGHGFPIGSDGGGVALSAPVLLGIATPVGGSMGATADASTTNSMDASTR